MSSEYDAGLYHTHPENQLELCATVSAISGLPISDLLAFRDEILFDPEIARYFSESVRHSPEKWSRDERFRIGRRLSYYLLVRSLKPARVVEAGVDRGLGALVICRALALNSRDGVGGEYIGIEVDESKSAFYVERYNGGLCKILFGDSPDVIKSISGPVDLFIHETMTEPTHVDRQIEAMSQIVDDHTVVVVPYRLRAFFRFAEARGWCCLGHKDDPVEHWSNGSRLMFLFRQGLDRRRRRMPAEIPGPMPGNAVK